MVYSGKSFSRTRHHPTLISPGSHIETYSLPCISKIDLTTATNIYMEEA